MTWLIALLVFAVSVVLAIRQAVRGFAAEVRDPEQLLGRTRAIDVAAFRNLISARDDDYLRAHLPWHALLRVRRARCLAASEYVRMMAHNAAILIRLGQAARASADPQVSESGERLVTLALETRLYALLAAAQLLLASLIPWWQPSLRMVTQVYPSSCSMLDRIVRLQRPEMAARISAAL